MGERIVYFRTLVTNVTGSDPGTSVDETGTIQLRTCADP